MNPKLNCRRGKDTICAKQYIYVQLLYRVSCDPLELPMDPQKVVAGSTTNPLKLKYSQMEYGKDIAFGGWGVA